MQTLSAQALHPLMRALLRLPMLLLALTGSATAQGLQLGLSLANEQVQRGISLAPGTPSPGVDAALALDGGRSLALSLNRLERDAAGRRWVGVASLAQRWQLNDDWSLEASVAGRHYPGPPSRRALNGSEWGLQLAWQARAAVSLMHNPGLTRQRSGQVIRGQAWALEASLRQPLPGPWPLALEAGLGTLHWQGVPGSRYGYGHLGLSADLGRWQLALQQVHSDAGPQDGVAANRAGGRWVGVVAFEW